MRTTILLSTTTAVVLIAGGIAFAQGTKADEHPGRAPAAQQNAPAEKMAPPLTQRTHKAPETTGQGTISPERSEQNWFRMPAKPARQRSMAGTLCI